MLTNKDREYYKMQAMEYLTERGYDVKTVVFLHEKTTKSGAKDYTVAEELFTFEMVPQDQPDSKPIFVKLLFSLKGSKTDPDLFKIRNPYGMPTSQMDIVPDSYIVWIGGSVKAFLMLNSATFDSVWDYKSIPKYLVKGLRVSGAKSNHNETVYVVDGSELKRL